MEPILPSSQDDLRARLESLRREYTELNASLPKHSIPPSMLMRLEELEEEIETLRVRLGPEADSGSGK